MDNMAEKDEQLKPPTAKEKVQAVLETLVQPKVIVDVAAGGLATWMASLYEPTPSPLMLTSIFFGVSNLAGIARGIMQSGHYDSGGSYVKTDAAGNAPGHPGGHGLRYEEGDFRTWIGKIVHAIRTGEPDWND